MDNIMLLGSSFFRTRRKNQGLDGTCQHLPVGNGYTLRTFFLFPDICSPRQTCAPFLLIFRHLLQPQPFVTYFFSALFTSRLSQHWIDPPRTHSRYRLLVVHHLHPQRRPRDQHSPQQRSRLHRHSPATPELPVDWTCCSSPPCRLRLEPPSPLSSIQIFIWGKN